MVKLNHGSINKKSFNKRRARLIGPEGKTIKCLEILCNCHIVVYGNTATILGSVKAIKNVKKVIDDCMSNVHPIYNIKVNFY